MKDKKDVNAELNEYKPLHKKYKYLSLVTSSIALALAIIALIIKLMR